jgi:hypothetical protein
MLITYLISLPIYPNINIQQTNQKYSINHQLSPKK